MSDHGHEQGHRATTGVVTWASPSGQSMDICMHCAVRLGGEWPKDHNGGEYCQVSHGQHDGECDVVDCEQEAAP